MSGSDHILDLVRTALDEFDDRPLEVTVRRAARIAVLLGDTKIAVRLGLELKPRGGHPPANADDTRRMMADPSTWGDPSGPAEAAMKEFLADRAMETDQIMGHSLGELRRIAEMFEADYRDDFRSVQPDSQATWYKIREIESLVTHRTFTALCAWERELTFTLSNQRIFARFQATVDRLLASGAPEVVDQFNAVFRRLAESSLPDTIATESLAQAVTSCRRILKAVADHVLPGVPGAASTSGNSLDDDHYRNRLKQFVSSVESESLRGVLVASVGDVFERFKALDGLASKGVHVSLARAEAELCAISTYVIAGEVLRLHGLMAAIKNEDQGGGSSD